QRKRDLRCRKSLCHMNQRGTVLTPCTSSLAMHFESESLPKYASGQSATANPAGDCSFANEKGVHQVNELRIFQRRLVDRALDSQGLGTLEALAADRGAHDDHGRRAMQRVRAQNL